MNGALKSRSASHGYFLRTEAQGSTPMFASLKTATAATALAAVAALLAPASASAQTYSYQGPQNYGNGGYDQRYDYDQSRYGYQDQTYRGGYDQCRSDRSSRQGGGLAVGATLGAVAGSQLAARGRRTEGSILGGVLGAVIGAGVGGSSARDCGDNYGRYDYRYDEPRYGQSQYGYQSYDRGYETDRYDRSYQSGYEQSRYGQSYDSYGYDRSGYQDGCRTVEVRSRDYNGRYVTRYEQSCPSRY
jgi:hypothetical protein